MLVRIVTAMLLAFGTICPALAQPGGSDDLARTETGMVRGESNGVAIAFRGIPYARPPVGPLRWRAPRRAEAWRGVRDATRFGADCMQTPTPGDGAPLAAPPSEDCLYLNVWQPRRPLGGNVPVLVWFHGGALVAGGSSPTLYDGTGFAGEDIVFVSVNYRLGHFGFFAHPALAREAPGEPRGNYGYMDQIAALEWVKRNIAEFGGDPERVTIMGQAAGSGPGLVLMTSPMARGLFHRAILPAAGYPAGITDLPPLGDLAAGEASASGLARELGATGEGAGLLAALRDIPAETLVRAGGWPAPVIDGRLIVEPPEAAIAAGRQAMVPILAGAHLSEGSVGQAHDKDGLFAWFRPFEAMARAAYDPGGAVPFDRIARQVYLDGVILEPARRLASAMAGAGQPVWHYRFSYQIEARRAAAGGAVVTSEIPFMFGAAHGVLGEPVSAADRAMAGNVLDYWAAFARTGDPNVRYLPHWRRFDPESGAMMEFAADGAWSGPDPLRARLDAVQARRESRAPPPAGPGPEVAGALRPFAALFLPPTRPAPGRPSAIFLGAASLLLADGPRAIVVNGFVSRPSEAEVGEGQVAPAYFRVHELGVRLRIPFVDAALVSDSHFDHAMDAPSWVRDGRALLIGSASTANIGRGGGLEEAQLRVARDREVFALGPFRVTAIAAPHAPHGVGDFPGTIDAPLLPPLLFSAYREGGSHSFLIEHGGRGILVHASADFRPGLMRGVRAETVLLGIAGLAARDERFVEAYWREIVRATGARIVVPIHWDRSGVSLDRPLEPRADFARAMAMLARLAARDGVALRLMPVLEPVDPFSALRAAGP